MTPPTYHGVVHGGLIVLDDEDVLSEGTEVLVTPVIAERGTAAALLAAMAAAPRVPVEWVDELEEIIEQGRRPPSRPLLFSDDSDERTVNRT